MYVCDVCLSTSFKTEERKALLFVFFIYFFVSSVTYVNQSTRVCKTKQKYVNRGVCVCVLLK